MAFYLQGVLAGLGGAPSVSALLSFTHGLWGIGFLLDVYICGHLLPVSWGPIGEGVSPFMEGFPLTNSRGFFIALESFDSFDPPMRLFGEHLVSNIAAYLALKNLPPRPAVLLCSEESVTAAMQDLASEANAGADSFGTGVLEDARTVAFDPLEGFIAPREAISGALASGELVITDRFLYHVDKAMPDSHLSLPVETLLFEGETQADCVIYLTKGSSPDEASSLALHSHELFMEMATRRPNVHIVSLDSDHVSACDDVWRAVKGCLTPWLATDQSV